MKNETINVVLRRVHPRGGGGGGGKKYFLDTPPSRYQTSIKQIYQTEKSLFLGFAFYFRRPLPSRVLREGDGIWEIGGGGRKEMARKLRSSNLCTRRKPSLRISRGRRSVYKGNRSELRAPPKQSKRFEREKIDYKRQSRLQKQRGRLKKPFADPFSNRSAGVLSPSWYRQSSSYLRYG